MGLDLAARFLWERLSSRDDIARTPPPQGNTARADKPASSAVIRYSLALLFRCAAWSFWMSSGESFGRSTLTVSLLSLPVKVNGGV